MIWFGFARKRELEHETLDLLYTEKRDPYDERRRSYRATFSLERRRVTTACARLRKTTRGASFIAGEDPLAVLLSRRYRVVHSCALDCAHAINAACARLEPHAHPHQRDEP